MRKKGQLGRQANSAIIFITNHFVLKFQHKLSRFEYSVLSTVVVKFQTLQTIQTICRIYSDTKTREVQCSILSYVNFYFRKVEIVK